MEKLIALQVVQRGENPDGVPLAEALESLRAGEGGALIREGELRELLAEREKLLTTVRRVQDELDTRRMVERAKAYLSRSLGLREDEAYRLLQKNSMDTRMPLREIAQRVLLVADLEEAAGKEVNPPARRDGGRWGWRRP